MKLYKLDNGKFVDVSPYVGQIHWSDSIDTLGSQLSFKYSGINLNLGDFFKLEYEDNEVIQGIATDYDKSYMTEGLIIHDFAWYLNKSEEIIQFNQMSSKKAIEKLLSKYDVSIGGLHIKEIIISKIYKDKKVSEIIKDILKQVKDLTGESYRLEMRNNKLYIEKLEKEVLNLTFKPASNLSEVLLFDAIGKDFNYKASIQELKNSILIVSDEEKSMRILSKSEDVESIKKYGLLQQVESIENANVSKAKKVAMEKLKASNSKDIDCSLTVPGNISLKSGRYVKIDNEYLSGTFLIKSTRHTFNKGIYKTGLVLGDDKNDMG